MKKAFALGLGAGLAIGVSIAAVGQDKPGTQALMNSMDSMMSHMKMAMTGDTDKDFAMMMAPHHQGAIDMAKVALQYGKDPWIKQLAQNIIDAQTKEIADMTKWLDQHAK